MDHDTTARAPEPVPPSSGGATTATVRHGRRAPDAASGGTRRTSAPRRLSDPSFPLIVGALGLIAALTVGDATDPDLFWHLRTGRLVLDSGIPHRDVFSYTVPGTDWVAHEWGSQVLMWFLWSAGGATALIVAFAALTTVTFALAAHTAAARRTTAYAVAVLGAAVARIATAPRPQMITLALVATTLWILEGVRRGRAPRAIWLLPPVIAVWANLHSGYLIGIVIVGVYAVGERIQLHLDPRRAMPEPAVRMLPLVTVAAAIAALINPNGLALWAYPFETLRSDAMRQYINEWRSPDFHTSAFYPLLALIVVAGVALARSPRRPDATRALLLAGTTVAALQSMRHVPILAVVAVPVVADLVDAARPHEPRRGILWRSRPIPALLAMLGLLAGAGMLSAAISGNDDAVAATYPTEAVDEVLAGPLAAERGLAAYHWGGYLIWRDLPVFIDGRADVYGDAFMHLFAQAEGAQRNWREPLDRYNVAWAMVPPDSPLASLLDAAPDWTVTYEDAVAAIFTRCAGTCEPVSAGSVDTGTQIDG